MSFIQSILQIQWQQYNPGTDYLSGGGGGYLTVNSLLTSTNNTNNTNNTLLVGAYFNNTVGNDYYFTMVNVSNTTGGGGGVYFNIPWNNSVTNNYPVVSVTSSSTLEYVYINFPDTYEANQYSSYNTNITSLTFDPLTGNCGTNNAAIDLCGNLICFNTICINNTIDSQAFMSYAIGGESTSTNQSNIYFCNTLPFPTPYGSNQGISIQNGISNFNLVSSSWQNITNYVVNCSPSTSFTYFVTSPTLDNSEYPNFTSITTTQSGTMIVVSANDDTYGGIYCLQNNGGDEFTPNTQSSRSGNWQMNGVIGIQFPLSSTYSTNWTTTTFQSITSTTLQTTLNYGYMNYIIGIQDNTTLLKIAFNVPTAYSNLICDCSYITPNIIGGTIIGPIVSLVSNIWAQNVVAFITSTQLFVSNDTGNNFYYIDDTPDSNYSNYSSLAITIAECDDPTSNQTPNSIIFLGTTNGSVYQITL